MQGMFCAQLKHADDQEQEKNDRNAEVEEILARQGTKFLRQPKNVITPEEMQAVRDMQVWSFPSHRYFFCGVRYRLLLRRTRTRKKQRK